jgi:segregation and condensation protein B
VLAHVDLLQAKLAIECLLFVAGEPLPRARLCELIGVDEEMFDAALEDLRDDLTERSVQVTEVAGGYRMMTRPAFAGYVEALFEPEAERVSRSAMEVLAIVAYRQPVTRPEIDAVRGVNSSGSLAGLSRKGLIRDVGRKETPGRPILYGTTRRFLEVTGLAGLDSLPRADAESGVPDAGVLGLPTAVVGERPAATEAPVSAAAADD